MVEMNFQKQAEVYVKKAKKKLKPGFFKKMSTSKSERYEEAKELYSQAGNCYKLCKQWDKCAECYALGANLDEQTEDGMPHQMYTEAANAMKKVSLPEAVGFMDKAINHQCQKGSLRQAAQNSKKVAEWYEEDYEYMLSVTYYKKAAELFDADSSDAGCWLKVADLTILTSDADLREAIKIYDQTATRYLRVPLLKPSAKGLVLKTGLLFLANDDAVGAQNCLTKYQDEDPTFEGSRESNFLEKILGSLNDRNVETFQDACRDYHKITPLDKLMNKILMGVKKLIEGEEENQPEGGEYGQFNEGFG